MTAMTEAAVWPIELPDVLAARDRIRPYLPQTPLRSYAPLDAAKRDSGDDMGWSPLEMAIRSIFETSLSWYFLFAAWAAFYVALSYARQLRASPAAAPPAP